MSLASRKPAPEKPRLFVWPILMKLAASMHNGKNTGHALWSLRRRESWSCKSKENVRAYAKHVPLRMATVYGGVSERPQTRLCDPASILWWRRRAG